MREYIRSWGGREGSMDWCFAPRWQDELSIKGRCLAVGGLRSYGDSCLPDGGTVIRMAGLDRVLQFDPQAGIVRAECGITLGALIELVVPYGWMLPVVPGTRFVTLGGAIANDVHGKNHHRAGSFGCHVSHMKLLTSAGVHELSAAAGDARFRATIGGLGLTGVILEATIRLQRIPSLMVSRQRNSIDHPDALLEALSLIDSTHEYTAAWVDCSAVTRQGRMQGYVDGANPVSGEDVADLHGRSASLAVPRLGVRMIRAWNVRIFNALYNKLACLAAKRASCVPFLSFLFPLDGMMHWNRLYGRTGFFQFQGVLPYRSAPLECSRSLAQLIHVVRASGLGSPLVVIKLFGSRRSPGMLSFPRRGVNVAIDLLPSAQTREVHSRLERIVLDAGGALYPAKDALMSTAAFRASFHELDRFDAVRDREMMSAFWSRVVGA